MLEIIAEASRGIVARSRSMIRRDGARMDTHGDMLAIIHAKHCACGRVYSAAAWEDLPLCGHILDAPDALELRHCHCGSTIAIALARAQ